MNTCTSHTTQFVPPVSPHEPLTTCMQAFTGSVKCVNVNLHSAVRFIAGCVLYPLPRYVRSNSQRSCFFTESESLCRSCFQNSSAALLHEQPIKPAVCAALKNDHSARLGAMLCGADTHFWLKYLECVENLRMCGPSCCSFLRVLPLFMHASPPQVLVGEDSLVREVKVWRNSVIMKYSQLRLQPGELSR